MTGAATVRDLAVTGTATLYDGGYQITGNASGTFTLGAGTGLTLGSASAATLFPTNFTGGNITLNATSTVTYNSDQSQTVSGVPAYGHLSLASTGSVVKTLSAPVTVNGNLSIAANNTFADNGYQITGSAGGTMTMGSGATLTLGTASSATAFPTNFITANIMLDAASTVVYNSGLAQAISAVPAYGNLTLSSSGTVTKTISAAVTVATDTHQ
jgi:hypothetical protein